MTWCKYTKIHLKTSQDFTIMDGDRKIRVLMRILSDGSVRVMAINEGWRP